MNLIRSITELMWNAHLAKQISPFKILMERQSVPPQKNISMKFYSTIASELLFVLYHHIIAFHSSRPTVVFYHIGFGCCLVTPLATSSFLNSSFLFKMMQIVDEDLPYFLARSVTTPRLCFAMSSFFKSTVSFFLLTTLFLVTSWVTNCNHKTTKKGINKCRGVLINDKITILLSEASENLREPAGTLGSTM